MLKTIVAVVLMLHGLVHIILGLVPNPEEPEAGPFRFFSGSWLSGLIPSAERPLSLTLAALATVGFLAAGASLVEVFLPFDWWPALAAASAVVSLLLLVIFWKRMLITGLIIDLAAIAAVLLDWSPE